LQSVSQTVSTGEAARRLGITQQAVRDRVRAGTLSGRREGREWRVDAANLPSKAPATPRALSTGVIAQRLTDIESRLSEMSSAQQSADSAAAAIARERDRYRAEAAAAREAALRLSGVTRDAVGAARQLLEALDAQAEAIAQLVGPGSPQDVLP
jgi:excisionase family DNA binding protein